MLNNELIEFIRGRRLSGISDDEIKRMLMQQGGWSEFDINEAMKMIGSENQSSSSIPRNPEGITANSIQKPPEAYRSVQNTQNQITNPDPRQPFPNQNPSPQNWTPRNNISAPNSKFSVTKIIIIALILVILIFGFIYSKKISNLLSLSTGKAPFTEQNIFSGVFDRIKTVQSSRYSVALSFLAKDRDRDAKPIVIPKIDPKIEEAYKRDYVIYKNVESILAVIESQRSNKKPFPKDLKEIAEIGLNNYPNTKIKTVYDNGKPYMYSVSQDKKHISLIVTFESQAMVDLIKNHYQDANVVYTGYNKKYGSEQVDSSLRIIPNIPNIDGKTVTFDETSGFARLYIYSDKYPESILSSYAKMIQQIPKNIDSSLKASGTYQKSAQSTISDFETSLDLRAIYGVTNFTAGFDIKKNGPVYFARLRDLPDISYFSSYKVIIDKWIKFDTTVKYSEKDRGPVSYYASYLSKMNNSTSTRDYSKTAPDSFKKIIAIAEKNNLFSLRNPISSETYNNTSVYRYDIKINTDKIATVFDEVIKSDDDYVRSYSSLFRSLNEDRSSEYRDFIENNLLISLWVDSSGIVQKSQFKIRIVPPEDQTQLSGKQFEFVVDFSLTNINEKINISVPDKFITPLEADKFIEDILKPTLNSKKNDAIAMSSAMQIRTLAESGYIKDYSATLSYNQSSTVHGAGIKAIGDAEKILNNAKSAGTSIYAITDKNLSSFAIYGKLAAPDKYFCLDSTGNTLTETSNKNNLTCTK